MESNNSIDLKNYILKKKELPNFASKISSRNFYETFPKEEYNFEGAPYKSYLYLGQEESSAILHDYFLLLKLCYSSKNFTYEHFYSVVKEFMEHLEAENVFFCYKTYYGHKLFNNNVLGFKSECEKLLNMGLNVKENMELNEFEIITQPQLKQAYNFKFFEFLSDKINGTLVCDNFVLEPILLEDCKKIEEVYSQDKQIENPPFYLDTTSKYYKYIKPRVADTILCLLPKEKAWSVVNSAMKEVAFFILSPSGNGEVTLNIVSDCDYMDSQLFEAINLIKSYACAVMDASKIIGVNSNDSLAYSNIATAYSLAKFLPNYNNAVGDNGLTRLNYTYSINAESDSLQTGTPKPFRPLAYATFSVYKKRLHMQSF